MDGLENIVEDIFPKAKWKIKDIDNVRKDFKIGVPAQGGGSNIQIRMVSERKNWENCSEEIVQENSAELKGTHFQMETVKST